MAVNTGSVAALPRQFRPPLAYGDPGLWAFLRGNLDALSLWPGNVFYVDPTNGDDTYDGTKDLPWATMNTAIGQCTTDGGELIVVKPGNHGVTSTVNFNVRGITVMAAPLGLSSEEQGESFTINADSTYTDGPAATITQPCRIVGIGFAGRQTAGESLLIDCQEAGGYAGGFNELINCRFSCWYGAMTHGVKQIGGAVNKYLGCSFDGLFGGFGTSAIGFYNDTGGFAAAYTKVLRCYFQSIGSGNHAILHATGSVPVNFVYAHNYLIAGWAAQGKFLDNNNVAALGQCADNWLAPLATQAAAFENLTNATIGFADNHYEEA